MKLRDYQFDIIDGTKAKMRYDKSVLIQLCTGGGKTALAASMVKAALGKGKSIMFCVHRKDLIKQTAKAFNDFDIDYSFIAAGYTTNPYAKAHIASIDTLRNRLRQSPVPDLVFIDECHLAGSKSWSRIINYYKEKGAWIIGLSATPTRLDGVGLGIHFDQMVQGPTMRWLIDNNYLSDYRMFAPSVPDLTGIKTRMGDYSKGELSDRMCTETKLIGDAIRHYREHAPGSRAIVYCVSRKHSEYVTEQFKDAGIAAHHIDGETPMVERGRIIRAFADGEIKVLSNVSLITTGFDLASQVGRDVVVETIIDLAPTQSLSLYLQKIGRGLRMKDKPAVLLDHAGNVQRHGMPCEERMWSLYDNARLKGDEDDERAVPVRRCPSCYFCHSPAKSCPSCGHLYKVQYREIKEEDGDLVEITPAEMAAQKKKDKEKKYWQLVGVARKRKYPNPEVWAKNAMIVQERKML